MNKDNQLIIREWLDKKFTERGRGVKKDLAEFLGISPELVVRMTKATKQGYRAIRADELVKIAGFFGEMPPGLSQEEIQAGHNELIALYEQLPLEQQQAILSLLKSLVPSKQKK